VGLKRSRTDLRSRGPVLISSFVHSLHRAPNCCATQYKVLRDRVIRGKNEPWKPLCTTSPVQAQKLHKRRGEVVVLSFFNGGHLR
jgi:hypothetical protein